MRFLQHELVEEAISRRQTVLAATDPGSPIHGPRLEQLEHQAHTAVAITALRCLKGDGDYPLLCEVLEQLVAEVAAARDAVEAERLMEGL